MLLVGTRHPIEPISAELYARRAQQTCAQLLRRGTTPILCGGSAGYIQLATRLATAAGEASGSRSRVSLGNLRSQRASGPTTPFFCAFSRAPCWPPHETTIGKRASRHCERLRAARASR